MAEEMGMDNIFIFGMKVQDVENLRKSGYDTRRYLNRLPELKRVIEQIESGYFNQQEPHKFADFARNLVDNDRCVTVIFSNYLDCFRLFC